MYFNVNYLKIKITIIFLIINSLKKSTDNINAININLKTPIERFPIGIETFKVPLIFLIYVLG